jgi:hypothetical protein
VGLSLAFIGGFIATRLKLPSLVGYLLAGVLIGPLTPGFVADTELAPQLAEIGVILLMFGVSFALGAFFAGIVINESDRRVFLYSGRVGGQSQTASCRRAKFDLGGCLVVDYPQSADLPSVFGHRGAPAHPASVGKLL